MIRKIIIAIIFIIITIKHHCLTFASHHHCEVLPNRGGVTPSKLRLLEGSDLILNCSLNPQSSKYNSSMISFVREDGHYILPQFVKPLDPFTAQLKIPNVSVADSDNYACQIDNRRIRNFFVCISSVQVGCKYFKFIKKIINKRYIFQIYLNQSQSKIFLAFIK